MQPPTVHEIFDLLRSGHEIPAKLQERKLADLQKQCSTTWRCLAARFQHRKKTTNAYLVPQLKAIEEQLVSLAKIVDGLPLSTMEYWISESACLDSLLAIREQCQITVTRIHEVLAPLTEWGNVPEAVDNRIQACTDDLRRQVLDLAIMWRVIKMSRYPFQYRERNLPRSDTGDVGYCPHGGDVDVLLQKRRNLLERSKEWREKLNAAKDTAKPSRDVDCWPWKQSSTNSMTPATEDWSEVGSVTSDTTKTSRGSLHYSVTWEVEECIDVVDAYAEMMTEFLEKVRVVDNEDVFSRSVWLEDVRAVHADLIQELDQLLREPDRADYAKENTTENTDEAPKGEAFEAIVSDIGKEVTMADIAKLVFLWTEVEAFGDIERSV